MSTHTFPCLCLGHKPKTRVVTVASSGLISNVIGFDERFRPLMTSIGTSGFFSTRANLCYRISPLSIKHVDAP